MTWIAISDNEKVARAKLAEVLNADSPGLSARADLGHVRGNAQSAGC